MNCCAIPVFREDCGVVQVQGEDADEFGYWDEMPLPTGTGVCEWHEKIEYVQLVRLTDPVTRRMADAMRAWRLEGWCVRTKIEDDDGWVLVAMRRSAAEALSGRMMLLERGRRPGGGSGSGTRSRMLRA